MSFSGTLFVVCYDISADLLRAQVARVLRNHGERLQRSVFACRLTDASLDDVRSQIAVLTSGAKGEACIRFYPVCGKDQERSHDAKLLPAFASLPPYWVA